MGPASIVNDLQPEQTEKSGLHNLTLKAYSPGFTRYTSKQLINLPLISPSACTDPRGVDARREGRNRGFYAARTRTVQKPSDLPDGAIGAAATLPASAYLYSAPHSVQQESSPKEMPGHTQD